jgi:hypothetical protein
MRAAQNTLAGRSLGGADVGYSNRRSELIQSETMRDNFITETLNVTYQTCIWSLNNELI